MYDDKASDFRLLEAVTHEVAMQAAERPTVADERVAIALRARVESRLAEMRRAELAAVRPVVRRGVDVPARLLALGRDALVARLDSLAQMMSRRVQFAHRDLRALDVDDLRRLVALVEETSGVNRADEP